MASRSEPVLRRQHGRRDPVRRGRCRQGRHRLRSRGGQDLDGHEITWEWASADKPHNVVQIAQTGTEEAAFDSGEPQQGNNITFRYTFEEAGIYRYVCTPHRQQTGRGAIVVVDEPVGIGGEANASENASEGGNASAGTNGTTTGTTMGTETETSGG